MVEANDFPSKTAIERIDRGPRGTAAAALSVSAVCDDALTVAFVVQGAAASTRLLINLRSARFLRAALAEMIGLHESGMPWSDWNDSQDRNSVHSETSSGIPNPEGSPADGQKQAPVASASAAAAGE